MYTLIINRNENHLVISGRHIGNGSEIEKDAMIAILIRIIKDRAILQLFMDLRTTMDSISTQLQPIHEISSEISRLIESGQYQTKAKCCPTVWNLMDKYL